MTLKPVLNTVRSRTMKDNESCCEDCGGRERLRRWKYEPEVKLCENCHEARTLEESGDE